MNSAQATETSKFILFQRQKEAFRLDATAETGQRTVAPDDPMARREDRNGICPVRIRHRPHRFRYSQSLGHCAVGEGLSVRDLEKFVSDGLLEIGTDKE